MYKRSREDKENPNYSFLVSWKPSYAHVKRESKEEEAGQTARMSKSKKAEILAQAEAGARVKKDIVRSLILISFMLISELVVYLGWNRFR